MHACFEREAIHHVEISIEHHASCPLFQRFHVELARVKAEHLGVFVEELRDDPGFEVLLRVEHVLWPVDEDRLLARVAMDIDVSPDWLVLLGFGVDAADEASQGTDFWVQLLVW